MPNSRRSLLVAAAALAGGAGCLGERSNVRYPDTDAAPAPESPGRQRDRRAVVDSTPGDGTGPDARTGQPAAATVPHPELATGVRLVYDEIRWFARDYWGAVETYQAALRSAAGVVEDVHDRMDPGLTGSSLATLRQSGDRAIQVARGHLGAHFAVDTQLADNVQYHLGVVEKFTRRGDHDRVGEELVRLRSRYEGMASEPYRERAMSRDPVQNRLYTRLRGDQEPPVAFGFRYPAGGYAARSYAGEVQQVVGRPVTGDDRAVFEDCMAALASSDRVDALYVRPYVYEAGGGDDDPTVPRRWGNLRSEPVYVQRFADASAAGAAVESLLGDRLTPEGRYRLGADDWRRVYWRHGGDVVYGFLVQAGEFVLATAPSEVAWEERVEFVREPER
jgi:hypothetical protein